MDIDPTLGGTPLGPPSAAAVEALVSHAESFAGAFVLASSFATIPLRKSSENSISPAFQTKPRPSYFAIILWRFLALPDTHTCVQTRLVVTFTLASYVHVGLGLSVILYNCVLIEI